MTRISLEDGDVYVRRSLLWLSGTRLSTIGSVAAERAFGADVVTLDLEDTVPADHKPIARESVAAALKEVDFGTTERAVRVNGPGDVGGQWIEEDLLAVVPGRPDFVRIPKASSVEEVRRAVEIVDRAEDLHELDRGTTKLVVHIENPHALRAAFELATLSDRIIGLVLSGEDYTESLHARRSTRGLEPEMLYGRGKVIIDARAAGVSAFDSVYMAVGDLDGFREEAELARDMGFDGKNCLNPDQVRVANEVFGAAPAEIDFAERAVAAYDAAISRSPELDEGAGTGVLPYVDDVLIGPPVALKARRTLAIAHALGLSQSSAQEGAVR